MIERAGMKSRRFPTGGYKVIKRDPGKVLGGTTFLEKKHTVDWGMFSVKQANYQKLDSGIASAVSYNHSPAENDPQSAGYMSFAI